MSELAQRFGENLRWLRLQHNLTQQVLGRRVGIGHASISLWEKGERSPSIVQLYHLCKNLGCSADELLGFKAETILRQGAGLTWLIHWPQPHSANYCLVIDDRMAEILLKD